MGHLNGESFNGIRNAVKIRLLHVIGVFFFLCSQAMAQPLPSQELKGPALTGKIDIRVGPSGISLHAGNAGLKHVLAELSRKTGIALTTGPGVEGTVSIDVKDAGFEEILKKICASRAVVYEYDSETGTCRIVSGYGFGRAGGNTGPDTGAGRIAPVSRQALKTAQADTGKAGKTEKAGAVHGLLADKKMYDHRGRLLYKPGELLVKLKKGVLPADIRKLHTALGSRVLDTVKSLGLQKIRLKKGMDEDGAAKLYMQSGLVDVAEKNALRYKNAEPDDPLFNEQWGMQKIAAPEAWDITTGNNEVVVAVIDTGVDYSHPDLAANIWINTAEANGTEGVDDDHNGYVDDICGWDFAGDGTDEDKEDNDPLGDDEHGTHVAGIIAASGNNHTGVAGVCWNLKIMSLKVQADDSDWMETYDIIDGMEYAMDNGARVINCSYGGGLSDDSDSERDMLVALRNRGILAVCAAGNYSNDIGGSNRNYPASYDLDNILAVAASDTDDGLSYYSNYGKTSVDVMAPGDYIKSTVLNNSYGYMSGTSMATPHVTGIAGLLLSANPDLDYTGLKSIIMYTVDPVESAADRLVTGW